MIVELWSNGHRDLGIIGSGPNRDSVGHCSVLSDTDHITSTLDKGSVSDMVTS